MDHLVAGNIRQRPRATGLLSGTEVMQLLGVSLARVRQLHKQGLLLGEKTDGRDWGWLPLAQQPALIRLRAQKAATLREARELELRCEPTLDGV